MFQSRFASVVLDDEHFVQTVRYISLNPVRARLVDAAEQWPWSSVRADSAAAADAPVRGKPALDRIPYFGAFLKAPTDMTSRISAGQRRQAVHSARKTLLPGLEKLLGRRIARRGPGRKPGS